MKKILKFYFRGELYQVNEKGQIKSNGLTYFSPNWLFLGGTKHHWKTRSFDVTLEQAFDNPDSLNGCLGWDKDHGTTRRWGGRYNGKVPRITNAYLTKH